MLRAKQICTCFLQARRRRGFATQNFEQTREWLRKQQSISQDVCVQLLAQHPHETNFLLKQFWHVNKTANLSNGKMLISALEVLLQQQDMTKAVRFFVQQFNRPYSLELLTVWMNYLSRPENVQNLLQVLGNNPLYANLHTIIVARYLTWQYQSHAKKHVKWMHENNMNVTMDILKLLLTPLQLRLLKNNEQHSFEPRNPVQVIKSGNIPAYAQSKHLSSYLLRAVCQLLDEGKVNEAQDLLTQYLEMSAAQRDRNIYQIELILYCTKGQFEKVDPLFETMKKNGFEPDITLYNNYLDQLLKHNNYDQKCLSDFMSKYKILDEASQVSPNTRTYNIILQVLSRYHKTKDILHILNHMQRAMPEEPHFPDIHTFTIALHGLAFSKAYSAFVEQFQNMLAQYKLQPTIELCNLYIRIYCEMSRMDMAEQVYQSMSREYHLSPNAGTFAELAKGYAMQIQPTKVSQVFDRMQEYGIPLSTLASK